jgi:3-oxoacyl-[acyl-carrier protein] reductase
LLDVDEQTWRKAWDLKVFGYINMCRAFYVLMKQRRSGVIINVTGNAAQTHDPEYICGVAGNAALTAFSQSLGSVSVRDGIRVISLNPGPVETAVATPRQTTRVLRNEPISATRRRSGR